MYVLGIETHDAANCPGRDPAVMRQMADKLSPDNASKAGLRIVGAFMNCPEPVTAGMHQTYFFVEAPDAKTMTTYFGPTLKLDPQQVWSIPEQIREMLRG